MTHGQGYLDSCARARAALAALDALRLAPTPENFRIWFVHLSGEDAALSRTLEQLQAAPEPVDEARCVDLYERFFVRVAEERALEPQIDVLLAELPLGADEGAFIDETEDLSNVDVLHDFGANERWLWKIRSWRESSNCRSWYDDR